MKILILLVCFVFVSCGGLMPRHAIYGKWQGTETAAATLTFKDDGWMKFENFDQSGKVISTENRRFTVVDDKNINIIETSQPEYNIKIQVSLENANSFKIQCSSRNVLNGRQTLDYPNICNFRTFQKIGE